jgi:subfamily B ATP-binding cassette protein MsbA
LTEDTTTRPAHLSTRDLVGRIVREEVRPHVSRIVLAVCCMVVVAVTTAALAWLIEPVLSEVFENKDEAMLLALPLAVVAVFAFSSGANYGQAVLMHYVGQRIIADLQKRLFAHLLDADLAFYHNTETGTLISRFTNDVNMMRAAVSTALTGIALDFLKVAFLVAVMFWRDWALALIAFFVFPVAILPVVKIGRRMRKVSARGLEQVSKLTAYLNETFQGARHVKAYGMEAHEVRRGGEIVETLFAIIYKALRVRSLSSPLMEFLGGIAIAVVIFYGGSQVIAGNTTMPVFMSFITALLLAYEPMKRLANLNANLQEGLAATQRVYALLDEAPSITDKPGAGALAVTEGEIAFDDVHFTYDGGTPALNGITLTVPAGGTAALVGPSGAGKSTVLNLIPRFYDVASGAVRIDGVDLREVTLKSLRAALALVSQEVSLFNDSVRDNIAYGRIDATEDEIVAAARGAAAHEFITALPNGYDTIVGEHGVKLSGGQRQRISIARAMLKNAPILLLDEATSSLDSESERIVQGALATLMEGRTTLVIAHRLSTIVEADVIYYIAGGRVAEQGSHTDLIAKNGAYARMYLMQYADTVEDSSVARARA